MRPPADFTNCIERHPAPSVSATKGALYPSVSVRSARVVQPKPANLPKVHAALTELGISTHLVMPTKPNVERLGAVMGALEKLVELKKANDRLESEMSMVRKRKEVLLDPSPESGDAEAVLRVSAFSSGVALSFHCPLPWIESLTVSLVQAKRSASVASSAGGHKRARRE